MKISIVKIPSRYERIDVLKDIDKVSEFLKRRGIKNNIETDDISKHIVVYESEEDIPLIIRPYNVIHICGNHVISVDVFECQEFTQLFNKLSKIRIENEKNNIRN